MIIKRILRYCKNPLSIVFLCFVYIFIRKRAYNMRCIRVFMLPQKKFTSAPRFREVIWIRAQIILLTQGNSLVELRKNLNVTLISVFNVKCFSQSGFVDVVNKLRNRLEYFLMILFTKYLVTNNLIEEFI